MKRFISIFVILLSFSLVVYYGCTDTSVQNSVINTDGPGKDEGTLNTFCGTGFKIINGVTSTEQLPLYAGGGNRNSAELVGFVYFNVTLQPTATTPGAMTVTYEFNDLDNDGIPDIYPWVTTAVHFDIRYTEPEIPQTNLGNPVPGQFAYNIPIAPPYNESVISFPVEIPPLNSSGEYAVAAHASIVMFGGVEGFQFYLPAGTVNMNVQYPGPSSYFQLNLSNAGALNGSYQCWCVDIGHYITPGVNYTAHLYSTYDPDLFTKIPINQIDNPNELDKVNWIVNNFQAGQIVTTKDAYCNDIGTGTLTLGDIQMAIWDIIDKDGPPYPGSGYDQTRINAIICAANTNGEGFVPGCGDKIVFIIVVNNSVQFVTGQVTISSIPVPCTEQGQTCWGDGKLGRNFPDAKSWATYFMYKPLCP